MNKKLRQKQAYFVRALQQPYQELGSLQKVITFFETLRGAGTPPYIKIRKETGGCEPPWKRILYISLKGGFHPLRVNKCLIMNSWDLRVVTSRIP